MCYWLDQFVTLAFNTFSSKFSVFNWICLPLNLLALVGIDLPMCLLVTLS